MLRGRTMQAALLGLTLVVGALLLFHVGQRAGNDDKSREAALVFEQTSSLHGRNLMQDPQPNANFPQRFAGEKAERKEEKESTDASKMDRLGVLFARDAKDWAPLTCDRNRKLRHVSLPTGIGNLTFYVYDSARSDKSVTARALRGAIFERKEIEKFLTVSQDLPLIDVGANVGLVTLQAAMQGRQVVSVEPIPENALRLCRSALDFGHAHNIHVINNAVSSTEGTVTLATDRSNMSTRFEVRGSSGNGRDSVDSYAIHLDRLLEVIPFKRAALKIDVESHEGHVISGAHRLFQEVDIPLVWMEWEHVKEKKEFGAEVIIDFMHKYGLTPHDLLSGKRLSTSVYSSWPFTVLWRKTDSAMPNA